MLNELWGRLWRLFIWFLSSKNGIQRSKIQLGHFSYSITSNYCIIAETGHIISAKIVIINFISYVALMQISYTLSGIEITILLIINIHLSHCLV